jgi:hypothetical protein
MVKEGDRVELISTTDPYVNKNGSLKPGDRGTVFFVDGLGTVHINWDNGSNLGLVPGEDHWKVISEGGGDG